MLSTLILNRHSFSPEAKFFCEFCQLFTKQVTLRHNEYGGENQ